MSYAPISISPLDVIFKPLNLRGFWLGHPDWLQRFRRHQQAAAMIASGEQRSGGPVYPLSSIRTPWRTHTRRESPLDVNNHLVDLFLFSRKRSRQEQTTDQKTRRCRGFDALFNRKDFGRPREFWSPNYINTALIFHRDATGLLIWSGAPGHVKYERNH